jgi:hypothetical protein
MAFLALVDAPLSSESMKFPVFSLLTGNFETETSSHVTPPSSGESAANLTSSPWRRHAAFTCSCNHGRERGKETPHDIASDLRLRSVPSPGRETCAGGR